jgi:hypothetical protein
MATVLAITFLSAGDHDASVDDAAASPNVAFSASNSD